MEDKKVDEYIEKQASPQKKLCKELRKVIFKTFPDIKEEMKYGVPCYADGTYYIAALKDHVNLGLLITSLTEGQIKLLQGTGKTMRHIEIESKKDIEEKQIIELLEMVDKSLK